MSLLNLIKNFKRNKRILFTTPSHNQGKFIIPESLNILGKKIFKCDYSEIDGFDNLSNPKSDILKSELSASKIYDSKYSFYLINGSTSGVIAAMLATLSQNDRVLITRNCHRSVYNGLVLTNTQPYWIMPQYDPDWDIYPGIDYAELENTLFNNPKIKAFIITNPAYEGLIFDIAQISEICKRHNVILIVDEAHGALWNFEKNIEPPAITQGADISIQSLHKTAGALNPSAIMHISNTSTIKPESVKSALNLINTTSPSYPLLLNIENTINFLNSQDGKKEISKLLDNIKTFKNRLKKYNNINIYEKNNDITKILVKIDGLTGAELSQILFEQYNIEDELENDRSVLFLTGIGTTRSKLKTLEKALIKIAKEQSSPSSFHPPKTKDFPPPITYISPSNAYNYSYIELQAKNSVGMISYEVIAPYPPGIPIILPGEVIQEKHLNFLKNSAMIKVIKANTTDQEDHLKSQEAHD